MSRPDCGAKKYHGHVSIIPKWRAVRSAGRARDPIGIEHHFDVGTTMREEAVQHAAPDGIVLELAAEQLLASVDSKYVRYADGGVRGHAVHFGAVELLRFHRFEIQIQAGFAT